LAQLPTTKRDWKEQPLWNEGAALLRWRIFHPESITFLAYQRRMADAKERSNAKVCLVLHQIPVTAHSDLLDELSPSAVLPSVGRVLTMLSERLSAPGHWAKELLVADGTGGWFHHDSARVHCSTRLKNQEDYYFHAALTPVCVLVERR